MAYIKDAGVPPMVSRLEHDHKWSAALVVSTNLCWWNQKGKPRCQFFQGLQSMGILCRHIAFKRTTFVGNCMVYNGVVFFPQADVITWLMVIKKNLQKLWKSLKKSCSEMILFLIQIASAQRRATKDHQMNKLYEYRCRTFHQYMD